jgi:hypothetical protein
LLRAEASGRDNVPLPEWLPILPEQVALKDCPENPGAPAMILYREETVNDVAKSKTVYFRIKIFTDEGKKYADVEIPYANKALEIGAIKARTIPPDGKVIDFEGQVYDRIAVKARKVKFRVKAFSLTGVEKGSIIEYAYEVHWDGNLPDVLVNSSRYIIDGALILPTADWIVSHELFTRLAVFRFQPDPRASVTWTRDGPLPGRGPERQADGSFALRAVDLPGFVEEDFMPPEDVLKSSVQFFYTAGFAAGPESFWETEARRRTSEVEKFIGKPKEFEKEVQKIAPSSDPPETTLRKLYARAQQIRYLSYEHLRTEKERKQENLKENKNVQDVLAHGYAEANEVNYLFVALCRAAGLPAEIVEVVPRNHSYFRKKVPLFSLLSAKVVHVRVGSTDVFLDPATVYCPFNLLPWEETAAGGIAVLPDATQNKSRGEMRSAGSSAYLVRTPEPVSAEAVTERHAKLVLAADGAVRGMLLVAFRGQEGLQLRLEHHEDDERARRKALEDKVKGWLPAGADVELTNKPAWETADQPLDAEFNLKVPDFGTPTRRRLLLQPMIFESGRNPFHNLRRIHPVDLHYPFQTMDDITVELPPGFQVEALPTPRTKATPFAQYEVSYKSDEGTLTLRRRLQMNKFFFQESDYPALHLFYDAVRAGDEQQAVFRAAEVARKN